MPTEKKIADVAIEAYKETDRPLKYHEIDMLEIMAKTLPEITGRVLDIGCADAVFLRAMAEKYPAAFYEGIDLSDKLLDVAKQRFKEIPNALFRLEDAGNIQSEHKYQALITSGILTCFDDPCPTLDHWLSFMEDNGALFMFGRFNSRPVHSKFMIKELGSDEWTEARTSYYTGYIEDYLKEKGYKAEFSRFHLPIDLPEKDNPLATYTVHDRDTQQQYLLSGMNVIVEPFFCVIRRI